MIKILVNIARLIVAPIVVLFIGVVAFAANLKKPPVKPRLVWGPIPIISNKYWTQAMRAAGYESKTIMYPQYRINQESDFDLYIHRLIKFPLIGSSIGRVFGPYLTFIYSLWEFDIFHHPVSGGFLGQTPLWRCEALFLYWARKKVVILPYGGDLYRYSKVIDPCLRHALLLSYPLASRREAEVEKRVSYWVENADVFVPFLQIDGVGRWDLLPVSMVTIDTKLWLAKREYSNANGVNGVVNIIHSPNHRGFKGTEFLVSAIDELRLEGLKVNLILVEGVPNNEVKRIMEEDADILAEQFIFTGYAMSGIEGMASGIPVLANLDSETYTRLFRRYSYLDECPVLSTTPESLKDNLRLLIINPILRKSLGMAGRKYVEKYHSIEAAQYIFNSVYDRIFFGKEVDLMNLFHPLKSDYMNSLGLVDHPLVDSRLPVE